MVVGAMWADLRVSKTADLLGFSCTAVFTEFTKKKSSQGGGRKFLFSTFRRSEENFLSNSDNHFVQAW